MADRNRRFALAAIALPLLLIAMSGLARATTFTVTTINDSGFGSLRAAITAANTTPTVASTINFSVSGTITLGSSLPAIANTSPGSLTIDGSGQAITVDGANSFQILSVNFGATLTLQFLTLTHGQSSISGGGAINNMDGTLTLSNCTFSGNSDPVGIGGALFNSGTMTVTDSAFSGNSVSTPTGAGGAIASDGTLTIINSTFSANSASEGGAIDSRKILTVTNSTFSANQATSIGGIFSGGGGIFNAGSIVTVTNSTFSGNNARSFGGGINSILGSVTLKGTILAVNTGGNCAGKSTPPVTDAGYNISDDNTCGLSGTSVNNSTTLHLDPAGLANNGGPTQTIALEPNSQAVDFIPVASCTDQTSPTPLPLTTDQRGLPRPDPGNPNFCDAGAFELQTMPFVLAPNSERVQIARGTTPDSDQVNMAFTFTENGFTCDAGDNAFNGFTVLLRSGSCGALDDGSLELMLEPWVMHTVNHMTYGTIFQSMPPETVSARMVQLPTPAAPACGEWTVNIEVARIDSSDLGNGPFALVLSNPDGDTGCFDITNAIVGNQIPTPTRKVRRRVRR